MSYMKRLLEDIMLDDVHVDECTCQVCDPEFHMEMAEDSAFESYLFGWEA